MPKTPRTSRRRHLRKTSFDRVRYDERTLDFWTTEGARLASSATGDTFVVNSTNDRCTAVAHGFSDGEGPYVLTTTDTLPAGLSASTFYWVSVISADQFLLHTGNREGTGLTQVDITDAGTGTHTITRAATQEAIYHVHRANKPRAIAAASDIDALA